MKVLGYIWRILVELFYFSVVSLVLLGLKNRTELLILSAIGLLYCTIRSSETWKAVYMVKVAHAYDFQIASLKALITGQPEPRFDPEPPAMGPVLNQNYIRAFFIGITYLMCLYTFFLGTGLY